MTEKKELVAWQERETQKVASRKRGGIVWDMGLGKTGGAASIGARAKKRRWLVLCPDNSFTTWRDEAPKWIKSYWPGVGVNVRFISGASPAERQQLWLTQVDRGGNTIWIDVCTPDTFIRDWGISVAVPGKKKKQTKFQPKPGYQIPEVFIFDEAKRIRKKDTIMFELLSKWINYYNPEFVLPMTGTPGTEPKHYWTMLHLIEPKTFSSWWKFVSTFHVVDEGIWGKEINEPRNLEAWYKILGRYFSVMKEDDPEVKASRPPITRQLLPITLEGKQKEIVEQVRKEMFAFVDDDDKLIIAANELAVSTRLRQLLICPAMLAPSIGVGGMMQDFVETVEPNRHEVIFTPFTAAFPHFEQYLRMRGFDHVYTLQGSMGTDKRDDTIKRYQDTRGVIICSVLYAQSFSLMPATRCFFMGYDWDPENNRQAEKRLQRGLVTDPIAAYYYTFRSTFDERLCEIVNWKMRNMSMTSPHNLRAILEGRDRDIV